MYKSPLVCNLTELDYAIGRLRLTNTSYRKSLVPFCTGLDNYKIARSVLHRIIETTGVKYQTIGDFILSVMPNEETKSAMEELLLGAGRQK